MDTSQGYITRIHLKDTGQGYISRIHNKDTTNRDVWSIKNANLSIKYEGIKLQNCLTACKKGINVVVRFQYSEISRLEN